MKKIIFLLLSLLVVTQVKAQLGYQVAVMDPETGIPKRNANVSIMVNITDKNGNQVYSNSYSTSTNEFGIASLEVGNWSMFDGLDWANTLPLYISGKIDNAIELPKTQILSVPIADYAKNIDGVTPEILSSKTWTWRDGEDVITLSFNKSGGGSYHSDEETRSFTYFIFGYAVGIYLNNNRGFVAIYDPHNGRLILSEDGPVLK